jgi:hypothetical protein
MGQHKKALEIYVFKMIDYAKAEEYVSPLQVNDAASLLTWTDIATGCTSHKTQLCHRR